MTKYGIEMILETTSQFKNVKYIARECKSFKEAEDDLKKYIKTKKELMKNVVNIKTVEMVME